LLGLVEPSGRLPVSFARHVGQQPTYYNQLRGQHGVRYADLTQEPAFCFGDGLSYTTVEYTDLRIDRAILRDGDTVNAEVTLTNTGARPALETVQAYVRDIVTSATWADKELKAFRQVHVAAGERIVVGLALPVSACTIVDRYGDRAVEPGEFDLLVGPSSRDTQLQAARFCVEP